MAIAAVDTELTDVMLMAEWNGLRIGTCNKRRPIDTRGNRDEPNQGHQACQSTPKDKPCNPVCARPENLWHSLR